LAEEARADNIVNKTDSPRLGDHVARGDLNHHRNDHHRRRLRALLRAVMAFPEQHFRHHLTYYPGDPS
jgi:hypothetical protein